MREGERVTFNHTSNEKPAPLHSRAGFRSEVGYSMIWITFRVFGSTITRRSLTTA
jgi:hypothetical protein